jgi:hypothetical protein
VKGYFDKDTMQQLRDIPHSTRESDKEAVELIGERIERNTFPDYATDDFWEAISIWRDFGTFGFPEAGGTMDQPALWMDLVRLMQSCADKMKVE